MSRRAHGGRTLSGRRREAQPGLSEPDHPHLRAFCPCERRANVRSTGWAAPSRWSSPSQATPSMEQSTTQYGRWQCPAAPACVTPREERTCRNGDAPWNTLNHRTRRQCGGRRSQSRRRKHLHNSDKVPSGELGQTQAEGRSNRRKTCVEHTEAAKWPATGRRHPAGNTDRTSSGDPVQAGGKSDRIDLKKPDI
jgi:hypothetical protein